MQDRCARLFRMEKHHEKQGADGLAGKGRRSLSSALGRHARAAGELLGEAVLETLWPTRCAVCDEPGSLLCDTCRLQLPYLDWWRACPRCGAPFGSVQCCTCTPVMLARWERTVPPFAGCASAVMLDAATGRIVTLCKDAGERRLAHTMANIMANVVPPAWACEVQAVSFVPASEKAVRRRGFDHAELLAASLANQLGKPCVPLLDRPASNDQRALGRSQRFQNTEGRFRPLPRAAGFGSVLLVDDVYTTGATLFAACDALAATGVTTRYCATFARTW